MNHTKRRRFSKAAISVLLLSLATAVSAQSTPASVDVSPATWSTSTIAPNPNVTTPKQFLGWSPGDDYKLDSWDQVVAYYKKLAATSDRIRVEDAGKTTEGRDYIIVTISSPDNLKNLAKLKQINLEITDPRKIKGGDAEADQLIAQGKTVVALTYGIHSTETASYLGGQQVAYRLAAQNDPETLRILDNTIIVLVPARNPDGVDIVKTSYDKRLAAQTSGGEGSGGRGFGGGQILINKYIGHDDNRDFVGATQPETRIELAKVYNEWHPQIVHDVHQQGENGPRLTLPPYTDPVEPNIPKLIVQQYHDLGHDIAEDLHEEGYKGVQTGGGEGGEGYDDWSPLRHYVHFHNAVRILQESAGVDIASPVDIDPDDLQRTTAGPDFLDPWEGGKWTIGDGVSLVQAATFSVLDHAATNREYYLKSSYQIAKDAVRPRGPGEKSAFLIPDAPNREVLLSSLYNGGVEIRYLTAAYTAGGTTYPKGTAVVRLDQPYGGYANALLSDQDYPNLRSASGTPIRPYDVTAHTLPLLYNVPVASVEGPLDAKTTAPQVIPETPAVVRPNFAVPNSVRIGLLKANSQDQGWVRFVLDQNDVKYTELDATDISAGGLKQKYDAILLATSPVRGGRGRFGGGAAAPAATTTPAADTTQPASPEAAEAASLKEFVNNGGTLIALNQVSDAVISLFDLPLKDVTQGQARADYFSPGEILETDVDANNPIAKGIGANSAIWSQNSPAWQVTDAAQPGQVTVIAHYPDAANPLLSGWLLGAQQIEGKAALVDVKYGNGHILLYGFVPLYRGLSLATYPLLFNALTDAGQQRTADAR